MTNKENPDVNEMRPLRELWDATPDKKVLRNLRIFYEKDPILNAILYVLNNDEVIIAHTWVIRTATPVIVDDLMYFPNNMFFSDEHTQNYNLHK